MCIKNNKSPIKVLTNPTKNDKIKLVNNIIRILWISRHEMTSEQYNDLERIYGKVKITQYDKTVTDIKEIPRNNVDVYAVVLPVNLISDLRKNTESEIIQSVSGRIFTGKTTADKKSEYVFKHLYWQKIIKFDIETERI